MNTTRPDADTRSDEDQIPEESLVTPDSESAARRIPAELDLTGVDPVIAERLARIAEQARMNDDAIDRPGIIALRSELDRVTEKLDHSYGGWSCEDADIHAPLSSTPPHGAPPSPPHGAPPSPPHSAPSSPSHSAPSSPSHLAPPSPSHNAPPAHGERWTHSDVAVVALGAAAALSLAFALFPPANDQAAEAPATTIAAAVPSAQPDAPATAANVDPGGEPRAEAARDEARAARFQSVKADAITYSPDLHLAAQRKEVEADSAFRSGNFDLAIVLYELARDGYQIATTRSDKAAAQIEKARVDEQVAMDAQLAAARAAAARMAERQFVETEAVRRHEPVDSAASSNEPAQAPIQPLILTPPSSGSASDEATNPVVLASLPRTPAREPTPRHANAWAAVYTEPTNGARSGGTWGACWRSSLDSARACAKANCEAGSGSHRRCVEVASSRPGEHCVVARAHGFGVSTGACSPGRRDAEMAALARCHDQLAASYGATSRGCSIAWSSDW